MKVPSPSPHLIRSSKQLLFLFFIITNLLLIAGSMSPPPNAVTSEVQTDELALLALKEKITQDPLGTLNSWNKSHHFCDWQGVTCNPRIHRVTVLFLRSQAIAGTISPFIGNLTFLREINLENNSFHGEIPREIGYLSRLERLRLSNNSIIGQIPPSLSNCSNLVDIHLSSNLLEGVLPAELGSLFKLNILSIKLNNLTGSIPSSFGNLSSLQHLTLNYNNLKGNFPKSFGQMSSLQFIRIGSNKLSGIIPPSLWNLSSLIEFYVVGNQFHGTLPPDIGFTLPNLENFGIAENHFSGSIPSSITNISRLDYIDMAKNNFSGEVPIGLGRLQYLKWLDLSHNQLKRLSFLNYLVNCSNLEKLFLHYNHFGGVLPHSISNLSTKLAILTLGSNQISGIIPQEIDNLVNLTRLSMDQNLLSGSIPFSIGRLHKLYQLKLNGNKLSKQIPSSLGNISHLYELSLQSNSLVGTIPLSLKNFKRLLILDLSDNNLNGTLPQEVIGSFSHLTYINLSHNSLTGSLPSEIGRMANLQLFDISDNRLSGNIPSTLGDCTKLEGLYMQRNMLQGNLSSFLNELKALYYLDLSSNNLSGNVPKDLEFHPSLRSLNLSFNDLLGELPKRGVFSNSTSISISGNEKLCGGISELSLPTCLNQKHHRSFPFKVLKIVVPIVVLILATSAFFIVLYWKRSSRTNPPSTRISHEEDFFSKVSYGQLLKATNRFSESNLIGIGSFGSVYIGTLQQDETHVAVKVLNLQQRGAAKTFMAEIETLGKIRHRNLVKIVKACSSIDSRGNEFKALVFKYIPNGNLENWLHPSLDTRQKLSFAQRLNIAINVAYALDYLHHHCENTIIHCDLKPSNVLLDDDLTAYVGDFGLAKILSTTQRNLQKEETDTFGIRGSIGYIAPEYGMGCAASTNGDIYSYGILLLEMFTGKRPVNDMFKDGLNLHKLTKMALPDKVMEVVDPRLLPFSNEQEESEEHHTGDTRSRRNITKECLILLLSIGVACSEESQVDRTDIDNVIKELHRVRNIYQTM